MLAVAMDNVELEICVSAITTGWEPIAVKVRMMCDALFLFETMT